MNAPTVKAMIKSLMGGLMAALMLLVAVPAMADALDDARAAGVIGERPDGLIGLVDPNAPANVKSLVQAKNAERMQKYESISGQKGVPAEQVGAIAGEKIINALQPGWYYMDASGNWVQK